MVSCAKVDSITVFNLYGDFSTPQSILFDKGLKPVGRINGLATYYKIAKGFE
jgi:hypothetical protein